MADSDYQATRQPAAASRRQDVAGKATSGKPACQDRPAAKPAPAEAGAATAEAKAAAKPAPVTKPRVATTSPKAPRRRGASTAAAATPADAARRHDPTRPGRHRTGRRPGDQRPDGRHRPGHGRRHRRQRRAAWVWRGPSGCRWRWARIGAAAAAEARLSQGFARLVVAREATIEQGLIGTLIAGKATVQRTTGVFLLIAGRVDGPVKAVLDWRGGLAFGAAFGLLWALLRRR